MDGAPDPSNGRPRTLGLHHVNLVVADVNRARRFYESALGLEFADEEFEITFLTTPGTGDSLALQQSGGELDRLSGKVRSPGDMGGVDHIGFAVKQGTIDELVTAVEAAGGSVLMRFANDAGEATKVFVADLDGYVLQLG
jgi:catechol 2,3-dioxygenase-like lactoylglutathione lyase family enzyme